MTMFPGFAISYISLFNISLAILLTLVISL